MAEARGCGAFISLMANRVSLKDGVEERHEGKEANCKNCGRISFFTRINSIAFLSQYEYDFG